MTKALAANDQALEESINICGPETSPCQMLTQAEQPPTQTVTIPPLCSGALSVETHQALSHAKREPL